MPQQPRRPAVPALALLTLAVSACNGGSEPSPERAAINGTATVVLTQPVAAMTVSGTVDRVLALSNSDGEDFTVEEHVTTRVGVVVGPAAGG